jgi:short-subunit dehydrogenase
MSPEDVEGVMAINYFSPVRLTLALLPAMVERGSGDVVNVSSLGAHMVSFGVGAYTASKAALEMFTEAMYVELAASGVRAHLFIPGTTRSEFSTDKEGNDPPFPSDPATSASPEQVATALLACIGTDALITYAVDRDAATGAAKNADPNGFLESMRRRLGGR